MAHQSLRELITLYWVEVWNEGHVELIREICGDPIPRHTAGPIERLSHDQQIARVSKVLAISSDSTHEVSGERWGFWQLGLEYVERIRQVPSYERGRDVQGRERTAYGMLESSVRLRAVGCGGLM